MRPALYSIFGLIVLLGCFLVVSRFALRGALTPWLGEARMDNRGIELGVDIHRWPGLAGRRADQEEVLSGTSLEIIEHWAEREFLDWAENGKVTMTRVLLARMLTGRDIDRVNRYLLAARPYAGSGSSYELRPQADYDFAEIVLAGFPFLFGAQPEVLWPKTLAHIVDVLLIEKGYRIRWTVPGSLGTVRETENHILMTEGTRMLRNLWLIKSGADDSTRHVRRTGEHARALARYIRDLEQRGLYEFNSQPYGGYTLAAVLIIHAFAQEPELTAASQRLLDRISYQYAASGMGLRRMVPFRRQLGRSDRTSVYEDPLTAAMVSWYGDALLTGDVANQPNLHHAVIPAAMPYRPGPLVDRFMLGDESAARSYGEGKLILIGRGEGSSPEIHYRGEGYLISAGGVSWGKGSGIVARPTVLIRDDAVTDLTGMLRIVGAGDLTSWNNTGVQRDFAVGKGPLLIPDGWRAVARSGNWRIFPLGDRRPGWVVTYSDSRVSLFAVTARSTEGPQAILEKVLAANPNATQLVRRFAAPGGAEFSYDADAPRGTWVMKGVDGQNVDRDYQAWPRLRFIGR